MSKTVLVIDSEWLGKKISSLHSEADEEWKAARDSVSLKLGAQADILEGLKYDVPNVTLQDGEVLAVVEKRQVLGADSYHKVIREVL